MADHEARRLSPVLFYSSWLLIILVSVIDAYLVLRHRQHILSFERNPVGRALIEWNGGQVWYLLAAKLSGTVAVCAVLLLIRRTNARLGLIVALPVACFQLSLLWYLLT